MLDFINTARKNYHWTCLAAITVVIIIAIGYTPIWRWYCQIYRNDPIDDYRMYVDCDYEVLNATGEDVTTYVIISVSRSEMQRLQRQIKDSKYPDAEYIIGNIKVDGGPYFRPTISQADLDRYNLTQPQNATYTSMVSFCAGDYGIWERVVGTLQHYLCQLEAHYLGWTRRSSDIFHAGVFILIICYISETLYNYLKRKEQEYDESLQIYC